MDNTRTVVIPCCGIDSVYGLISQEIAMHLKEQYGQPCNIVGLSYLVSGEVEAEKAIMDKQCIAINGCNRKCASDTIDFIGGETFGEYIVTDIAARMDSISLGSPTKLTSQGRELVSCAVAKILQEKAGENV